VLTVDNCSPAYDQTKFLTISGMQLDVASSDDADAVVGTFVITLLVKLKDYSNVAGIKPTFTVIIRPSCRIDTFTDFLWNSNSLDTA